MQGAAKEEEAEMPPGTLDWYDGIAYGRIARRIYIPAPYRERLLLWFHASRYGGHQGVTRTANRMRRFVWWPKLQASVQDFIASCPICNSLKPLRRTGGTVGALDRPRLFQLVSMDYVGPRTYNNKTWSIFVMIDHYSRFMVTTVAPQQTAGGAITSLRDHWVAKFGVPRMVLCDQGPQFQAQRFQTYVTKTLGANCLHIQGVPKRKWDERERTQDPGDRPERRPFTDGRESREY